MFMSAIRNSVFFILILCSFFRLAECKAEEDIVFDAGKVSYGGVEMPYRVAHVEGEGKPLLAIYLHGGSSKGDDNATQLNEAGIDSIANYLKSSQTAAVSLVPQCPADKSWGGPMLGVLKVLIDQYVEDGGTDKDRLYIFGGSMGGTGTWSMLSAYPNFFAAAMPVAGNPSKSIADNVAFTPVFTVMGTADRIMNVETTSDFIVALEARNGIAIMEVEEGWTHEMTCIQRYTARRLAWVFGHNRDVAAIESPKVGGDASRSVRHYSVDGRLLPESPRKGIFILRGADKGKFIKF